MPNYDIGAKSPVQINWEENGPINDELREVMEPLAEHFRDEMGSQLQDTDEEGRANMLAGTGNVYTFKYGRTGMIPVTAFGEVSEDKIVLSSSLKFPEKEKAIDTLTANYEKREVEIGSNKRFRYYSRPTAEIVSRGLNSLKGQEYPEENWQQAAGELQRAIREEPVFIIDTHLTNRLNNAALDFDELNVETQATHAQHESYVVALSRVDVADKTVQGTRDTIQLPIGEYGPGAAEKLARVTLALNDMIKSDGAIDAGVRNRMDAKTERLLVEHTARSRDRSNDGTQDPAVHGVKNTLTEGILSIAQTISFLTAEKLPGYENHDELVKAILESDVIEQFTRLVKPGYIGPVTLSGLYMHSALTERNGKLALSKDAFTVLHDMRKKHVTEVAAQWALYKSGASTQKPMVLGLVCPAAAPGGAITTVKPIMKAFYQDSEI